MALCPVVGPLFYLLAYLFYKFFFSEPVDLEDVIFSKDKMKSNVRAEEERESNLVSLEEAIEITNDTELRTLMMNVVRGDIQNFLSAISLALNSEDTETAHYAASVLQDALNNFRIKVERFRKQINEGGEELPEILSLYAEPTLEYMDQVLKQKVFTEMEQLNYVHVMDEIAEKCYAHVKEQMTAARYEAVSLRLLEIHDYETCRKWCVRATEQFPESLSSYTCRLKLYFATGEKERFFETVEELKKSPVVVDKETLEFLRVFR
ncbi:MAG: hypothetical protein IJ794_13065 [Lachnospiraceae bacterium]|nr:hypothetical protein [Lachnospiraceae bacterium]